MRTLLIFLPVALLAQTTATKPATKRTATSHATPSRPAPKSAKPLGLTLSTDEQKTVYAVGLFLYQASLQPLNLSPTELAIVKQAIADAAAGKPALDLDTWGSKLEPFAKERERQASEQALATAAGKPGAVKTDSGLIYREVTPGTGPSPKATDTVRVNYRGTLVGGTEFDSSSKHNGPAEFPLDHVIKCWTEGVQRMKVGGKAVLVCPSSIAYGDQGRPPVIPPGATLTFEIELLGIGNSPPSAK